MAFPKDRRSRDGARAALVPASIALVLIVGAVEVALRARKSEPTALPEPAVRDPFADLPPEAPPEPREAPPRAPKLASKLPAVPEDVAQDPQWLGAKLLAAEASALYDLALSAKAKGELALASTQGKAAREKYAAALEATAAWEEELMAKYDPADDELAAIKSTRSNWFSKLQVLEQSFGPR